MLNSSNFLYLRCEYEILKIVVSYQYLLPKAIKVVVVKNKMKREVDSDRM